MNFSIINFLENFQGIFKKIITGKSLPLHIFIKISLEIQEISCKKSFFNLIKFNLFKKSHVKIVVFAKILLKFHGKNNELIKFQKKISTKFLMDLQGIFWTWNYVNY